MEGASRKAERRTPKRTCVGCGRSRGQTELVRFGGGGAGLRVHLQGGDGRGVYVCPDPDCLERAVKRRALQRVLGAEISSLGVQGLREAVDQAVLQKVQRLIGLARRAKRVVAGSRAVGRALDAGRVRLLLVGTDIFPWRGRSFQVQAERRGIPVVTVLSREDLGAALAGPSRETIGLLDDGFAQGILRTLRYRIP